MPEWSYCPGCGNQLDLSGGKCRKCGFSDDKTTLQIENQPSSKSDDDLDALTEELRDSLAPDFLVLRSIGQGGMGTVFLAQEPALKRQVVVKVLNVELSHDLAARKRFMREAEAAAAVAHPNVVKVFRVGKLPSSGAAYMVMEYIDGVTLAEEFPEDSPVLENKARTVVGEIASALAAAHDRGLIHRDIKPANVMIDRETGRSVVLDFGISAVMPSRLSGDDTKLTAQGVSIGTPQTMSPEQAAGEDVTDRSDVYSLGVVAFELVTGKRLFNANSAMALLAAHIKDEPPKTRSLRPDLDPSFADLIDRCLSKSPTDRPSARSLEQALMPNARIGVEWPPPGLDRLQGAGGPYLHRLRLLAVVELIFAFVAIVAVEDGFDGGTAVAGMMLVALPLLGYAMYASWKARHLPGDIRRALNVGYSRGVVFNLLLDAERDTESLINQMGVFARLSSSECSKFLAGRRRAFVIDGGRWLIGIVAAPSVSFHYEFGWPLLVIFLVVTSPLSWLATRGERKFRKAYIEKVKRDVRKPLNQEVATEWMQASEASVSTVGGRWLPPTIMNAIVKLAVLASTILVVTGTLNWAAVGLAFGHDPAGSTSEHVQLMHNAFDAASSPEPSLAGVQLVRAQVPSDAELALLLDTATGRAVHALGRSMDSASWPDLAQIGAERIEALDSASKFPALEIWRSLRATELPEIWYRDQPARRTRELWHFAVLNNVAAALHLLRQEPDEAVNRIYETLNVGIILARDPGTARAGARIFGIGVDGLENVIRLGGASQLQTDLADVKRFEDDLGRALEAFNGPRAAKAISRFSTDREVLLEFLGANELRPVHRWGLLRAAVLSVCYSGAYLMSGGGNTDQKEFVSDALERVAQMQSSDRIGAFLVDVDLNVNPFQGRKRWIYRLLWSMPRLGNCQRAGLLQRQTE